MEEIKICPRCKKETKQLFFNYRKNPLCKECLNLVLKENRSVINSIRNFVN